MTAYAWTNAGGGDERIDADRLTFEPQHVAFWRHVGAGTYRLIVAVRADTVHDLRAVDDRR